MKKATKEFAKWAAETPGREKAERMYERGLIGFEEYILTLMDLRRKAREEM